MLTIYSNNDVEFHVDMHKIEPNANRHGGTTGLKIVRSEYTENIENTGTAYQLAVLSN